MSRYTVTVNGRLRFTRYPTLQQAGDAIPKLDLYAGHQFVITDTQPTGPLKYHVASVSEMPPGIVLTPSEEPPPPPFQANP